ncbi:MAG: hypothetical protein ACXABY_21415 [Candidatus Thorarchaeota archaeon]|jgi:hypothetical protein
MEAPSLLLPGPPFDLTPAKQTAFEDLCQSTPAGGFVDYRLSYPKWQYLSYLCETRELVLHGSQSQSIGQVEPRQANDKRAFSNQRAIYATTDGIWVIYFAILDRSKHSEMSLFNSCLRAGVSADQLSDPMYFFSITHSVLLQEPWCEGMIYILPRQSFEQEASQQMQGMEIVFPHWISTSPAKPIAKLHVGPQDFPFLAQIHGHNDEKLVQLATANPSGFPWPEALES